jgi:sodium-dependent dicarboxylate transporter 2/3/5
MASNMSVGTIIGTPPNIAYVSHIQNKFLHQIGFLEWMMVCTPLSIVLMISMYFILVKWLYPNHIKANKDTKDLIHNQFKELGKFSTAEKRVFIIFISTSLLWITKDLINKIHPNFQLDDTMIALMSMILLFAIPSGMKSTENSKSENLLEWEDSKKMAWGILLLFGGGIALAKALEDARLMEQLGNFIASYATNNVLLMMLIVTAISVFLSEVMSNVAQVIVMTPVISSVAISLHMDPLLLGIPMTLGASCASMLPMGTPPNAIVFASGHIKMKDMVKTGLVMNLISIVLITLFCYLVQPMIMGVVR